MLLDGPNLKTSKNVTFQFEGIEESVYFSINHIIFLLINTDKCDLKKILAVCSKYGASANIGITFDDTTQYPEDLWDNAPHSIILFGCTLNLFTGHCNLKMLSGSPTKQLWRNFRSNTTTSCLYIGAMNTDSFIALLDELKYNTTLQKLSIQKLPVMNAHCPSNLSLFCLLFYLSLL